MTKKAKTSMCNNSFVFNFQQIDLIIQHYQFFSLSSHEVCTKSVLKHPNACQHYIVLMQAVKQ